MPQRTATISVTRARLLVLFSAAFFAVTAVVLMLTAEPAKSVPAFEYALPVNAAELSDAELARTLNVAEAAGANTISSGAVWWYLNEGRQPRSYNWSSLDRLIAAAEQRGMKVSLQLSGTPDWVHPQLASTVSDPRTRRWHPPRAQQELGHWSDYVHDVVSRYKGRVARYEIWNEQNINHFWKPEPNPGEYAALLRAAYFSAKAAHSGAVVCFGGLASNDLGYLNAYYTAAEKRYPDAAGNRYFFDVLGVHPYSTDAAPDGSGVRLPLSPDRVTPTAIFNGRYGEVDKNFLGIKRMKSAMDARGDSGKSLYLGEYGFSTADTPWVRGVPDYRRALYLKRAYALARDLPYVAGLSWYYYRPSVTDGPEWSIVGRDWSPSLTYRALKQITGAEPIDASVRVSAPENTVSGVHEINPALSGLKPSDISKWEIYVDGALKQTTTGTPVAWNTRQAANGKHELMVAAYTADGSVWPSNSVPVTVDNGVGEVTVSLGTDASNYAVGDSVRATATLSSSVGMTVDRLSLAVRPEGSPDSARYKSFYYAAPYNVEAAPKTVTTERVIDEAGAYVLWLSYYKNGSWHWLKPESEFTVVPTSVVRPDTAPEITSLLPTADSRTKDRTPTMSAIVRDAGTNLEKPAIRLYFDGRQRSTFSYDSTTDRLYYTPARKIPLGRHTVKVITRDDSGLSSTRSWQFSVKR